MGESVIRLPKLISLGIESFDRFPNLILLFDVSSSSIGDGLICNVDSLNDICSQIKNGFSFTKFLADGTQAIDVFTQINNISWDDTWNVIPLMLLVSKMIVYETVIDV